MKPVLLLTFCVILVSCDVIKKIDVRTSVSIPICEGPLNSSSQGFQNGDGTPSNPYIICSETQLNLIGNDNVLITKHYELGQDIDMSGISYNMIAATGGNEFSGSIEGKNFSISNLSINEPTLDYVGLIRSSTGAVKNLHLKNIDLRGKAFIGGIVGENFGTIENSSVQGTVIGSASNIGGIAGYSLGDIQKSFSDQVVVGGNEGVGVFVGTNEGDISNSYAIGSVDCTIYSCSGDIYGGFVGYMNDGSITNSYCVSDLMDVTPTLGYGFGSYSFGTVSGNFWNGDVYTLSEPSIGTELTTAQMKQQISFVGWDFVNVWGISPTKNNGYPFLR